MQSKNIRRVICLTLLFVTIVLNLKFLSLPVLGTYSNEKIKDENTELSYNDIEIKFYGEVSIKANYSYSTAFVNEIRREIRRGGFYYIGNEKNLVISTTDLIDTDYGKFINEIVKRHSIFKISIEGYEFVSKGNISIQISFIITEIVLLILFCLKEEKFCLKEENTNPSKLGSFLQ